MAGVQQIATISKDDTSRGHKVYYDFSLRSLFAVGSCPVFLEYNLNCSVLPTSWRLGISYNQDPTTGQISAFISVNRTDTEDGSVYVTVKVAILNGHINLLPDLRVICCSRMLSNNTIQGLFEDSRPPGYVNYLISLKLVLRIILLIEYCHKKEKLKVL